MPIDTSLGGQLASAHACDSDISDAPAIPGNDAVHASLEREIRGALNRHSAENASNTPDFILAQYLLGCLAAWNAAVQQRETWYGRDARPTGDGPVPGPIPDQHACALVGCVSKGPHGHNYGGSAATVR